MLISSLRGSSAVVIERVPGPCWYFAWHSRNNKSTISNWPKFGSASYWSRNIQNDYLVDGHRYSYAWRVTNFSAWNVAGTKFVLLTSLTEVSAEVILHRAYDAYADAVMKNPFHTPEMPIRSEGFDTRIANLIGTGMTTWAILDFRPYIIIIRLFHWCLQVPPRLHLYAIRWHLYHPVLYAEYDDMIYVRDLSSRYKKLTRPENTLSLSKSTTLFNWHASSKHQNWYSMYYINPKPCSNPNSLASRIRLHYFLEVGLNVRASTPIYMRDIVGICCQTRILRKVISSV